MNSAPHDNAISVAGAEGRKQSDTPGIIAPGPWLMFGSLFSGHALDLLVGRLGIVGLIERPYRVAIAVLLGALGLWVVFRANVVFHRLGTAFEPWKPTAKIAAADIYARTRNPMYQGFFIMGPGIALVMRSDWGMLLLIPAALIVHFGVVLREERYLKAKFGESYLAYMAAVPRYGWPFPGFSQARPKP
jgi:protein-S-isoprenylcysteine O-methyltransferase Ste14